MQYRNPLSELTFEETAIKFNKDVKAKAKAYTWKNNPLYLSDFWPEQVEFIGGLWRIQRKFNNKITKIHDKEFVIGNKINRSELPKEEFPIFDYYHAATLGLNCYGYILGNFDHIVSNCGDAWAYGKDISGARSKLSGKVIDVVTKNSAMCKMIFVEMIKTK